MLLLKHSILLTLSAATFIVIPISGCSPYQYNQSHSIPGAVSQNLAASNRLAPGMTKEQVLAIMGAPIKSDFRGSVEEWHYCKTGIGLDEFVALFFHENALFEKSNYTVTMADVGGVTGSCEKFIKMGNYREPDKVFELRRR